MENSNLTVYVDSQEPYLKYGLLHFMKRYGLSLTDNRISADIYLGYSSPAESIPKAQIILNNAVGEGQGFLRVMGRKIPIFKKPGETDSNGCWASAIFENKEYSCISISQKRIIIGFDIFSEIGRILAGDLDGYFLTDDSLGKMLRSMPVVDVMEDALAAAIQLVLPDPQYLRSFKWPEGRKFGVVVTHDVDRVNKTYQYLPSILRSIKKASFTELSYHLKNMLLSHGTRDPYWTFEELSRMEASQGIKSTYYFLNEKGRINPFSFKSWILYSGRYQVEKDFIKKNIQKLNLMGHEIGVHGSYNSYQTTDLLLAEKRTLESIIGSEVSGIRQHHLNYDIKATPGIHHNCGFKYDTTIGFKPDTGVGFRRGTGFPFQLLLPDKRISPQLEIPLIIMDVALNSSTTLEECLNLVDQVEIHNGILTILWHSNSLNRREYPMLFEAYSQIINKAKSKGAWIARASDIYEWIMK